MHLSANFGSPASISWYDDQSATPPSKDTGLERAKLRENGWILRHIKCPWEYLFRQRQTENMCILIYVYIYIYMSCKYMGTDACFWKRVHAAYGFQWVPLSIDAKTSQVLRCPTWCLETPWNQWFSADTRMPGIVGKVVSNKMDLPSDSRQPTF